MSLNFIDRFLFCEAEWCAPVNQSQGRTLNTSAHGILLSQLSRKPQHTQAVDGTMLTSIDKRQRKISFNGVCGSPMTAGLPYTHPSCVTVEGACPHSAERRYNSGVGQGPYDTVTSGRDKRASVKTK